MDHNLWNFVKLAQKKIDGWNVIVMYAKIPGRKKWYGIGVDPGRSFGLATLFGREAWLIYGTMPKEKKTEKWRYGVQAFEWTSKGDNYHGQGPAVVEGPAYKMPHGQSDLAHIRMGFVLGLRVAGHDVDIIPPASIRAEALGKGNIGGLEVWPNLNHNAGDALATALYSAGLRREDKVRKASG